MVLDCPAPPGHLWTDHSGFQRWVVEWHVCKAHYARLRDHEAWTPDYGTSPLWQRWIVMSQDLTTSTLSTGLPAHPERSAYPPAALQTGPSWTRSEWPAAPAISDTPGCLVLGCADTAQQLWAHTAPATGIVRWPVCRTHYLKLQAGDPWQRQPSTPPHSPGWLVMGDELDGYPA
jgi:hypothetical protein